MPIVLPLQCKQPIQKPSLQQLSYEPARTTELLALGGSVVVGSSTALGVPAGAAVGSTGTAAGGTTAGAGDVAGGGGGSRLGGLDRGGDGGRAVFVCWKAGR